MDSPTWSWLLTSSLSCKHLLICFPFIEEPVTKLGQDCFFLLLLQYFQSASPTRLEPVGQSWLQLGAGQRQSQSNRKADVLKYPSTQTAVSKWQKYAPKIACNDSMSGVLKLWVNWKFQGQVFVEVNKNPHWTSCFHGIYSDQLEWNAIVNLFRSICLCKMKIMFLAIFDEANERKVTRTYCWEYNWAWQVMAGN